MRIYARFLIQSITLLQRVAGKYERVSNADRPKWPLQLAFKQTFLQDFKRSSCHRTFCYRRAMRCSERCPWKAAFTLQHCGSLKYLGNMSQPHMIAPKRNEKKVKWSPGYTLFFNWDCQWLLQYKYCMQLSFLIILILFSWSMTKVSGLRLSLSGPTL